MVVAFPLKVSILVPASACLPAWETEMLGKLTEQGLASVLTFIREDPKQEEESSPGLQLFQRFENWWFRSIPDAFQMIPVKESFGNFIEIANINALPTLPESDLIYCSCLATAPIGLENKSRLGAWRFSFGAGKYRDARPFAFWETNDDVPEISSRLLVRRKEKKEETCVYEGTTPTVPFSVKNTLNSIAWKSSSFFQFRILELTKKGPEKFFNDHNRIETLSQAEPNSKKGPNSIQALKLFVKNGIGYLRSRWSAKAKKKRFTIAVSKQELQVGKFDLTKFQSFDLPKDVFWADPFIIERNGEEYVFFEEFLYKENRGRISLVRLLKDGGHSKPVPVLDKPYHLSYPFIFEFEGALFMIPETSQNKTVELYRCIEFPYKWEFAKNLMENIVLIDATILFHNGKWWLFGTGESKPFLSSNDQLFLYYGEDLFSSQWTPHPSNPIATRVSNCRPAGRIFRSGDKLYRPAQNNASRLYGYAIKINEIEILNEREYREKEIDEIIPDGNDHLAIHTLNFTGKTIVIDSMGN